MLVALGSHLRGAATIFPGNNNARQEWDKRMAWQDVTVQSTNLILAYRERYAGASPSVRRRNMLVNSVILNRAQLDSLIPTQVRAQKGDDASLPLPRRQMSDKKGISWARAWIRYQVSTYG